MRVKRYIVDSMPDALQRIRSDLGKDAVILNTKEVKTGGVFGFFSRRQIEVIAAIDSIASSTGQTQLNTSMKPGNEKEMRSVTLMSGSNGSEAASTNFPPVAVMDPEHTSQKSLEKERAVKAVPSDKNEITEEIKEIKKMMYKLVSTGNEKENIPEFFRKVEKQLIDHEFDPLFIHEIIQSCIDQLEGPIDQLTEKQAYQIVKAKIKEKIDTERIHGISEKTKIVNFVGPTGVGKTTSIAKLAAEQVLKYHRKVGFITSDTYRIAAVEQLKTYATILNVPLEVVYSPQDLKKALEKLKDLDLIFMDTAGRNYRNEMYVSELNSLLKTNEESETYLVLSLTMKYKDMKAVTDNFSKFKIDKVLFTKKDETDSYGPIFNLANHFSIQLSYIANGQNVPDDISKLNVDELLEQILEEE